MHRRSRSTPSAGWQTRPIGLAISMMMSAAAIAWVAPSVRAQHDPFLGRWTVRTTADPPEDGSVLRR